MGAPSAEDIVPLSPNDVLEAAFANMYDCDTRAEIELVMRSRTGAERRRVLNSARKDIDGRQHAIGRVLEPAFLRGMTLLTINEKDQGQDAFIFMPEMRMTRRITTAQRADAFLGSDVTYEDLERPRPNAYERIEFLPSETLQGEPVRVVLAFPSESRSYERVQFLVARRDSALLAIRYFKRGAAEPFRVLSAERASMHSQDGHTLPTEISVSNLQRGTSTRVSFRNLEVNPEIDDKVFSSRSLDRMRDPLAARAK